MIREAISKLVERTDLTDVEAEAAMGEIMRGEATPSQIAAFMTALRMKGERASEIIGCARAMRASAIRVACHRHPIVDTCGTGGDGTGTFNISTTAAFVLAGAGIAVAKHGNRSVSSHSGSADLLEALGVTIDIGPEEAARCIDDAGIGFLFAQRFHPAMKHAAGPRRETGIRTIFNLLGPLANPAGATAQLVGVYSSKLPEIMAAVLGALGVEQAIVVHGHNGLDELSTTGRNKIARMEQGKLTHGEIDPRQFGLPLAETSALKGGDPADNARLTMAILRSERGPKRDVVLLNAAAGIMVGGEAKDIAEGLALAAQSIDSGRALRKLEQLVDMTQTLSKVTAKQ